MATIKNNFDLLVEKLEAQANADGSAAAFQDINLQEVFIEIEDSLEQYRAETEKKHNDSKMELANIILSI